jgi:hypothetical protein
VWEQVWTLQCLKASDRWSGRDWVPEPGPQTLEDCQYSAQVFFQDYHARVEAKYEGQRVDGTHAVNGTIRVETLGEDFQCSYNTAGDTLVGFVAEGKSQPTFVKGGGRSHMNR